MFKLLVFLLLLTKNTLLEKVPKNWAVVLESSCLVLDQIDTDGDDGAEEGKAELTCSWRLHVFSEEQELDKEGKREGRDGKEEEVVVGLSRLPRPRPREDRDRGDNVERANVDDEDKERNEEQKYRQNHLFHLSS